MARDEKNIGKGQRREVWVLKPIAKHKRSQIENQSSITKQKGSKFLQRLKRLRGSDEHFDNLRCMQFAL